MIGSQSFPRLQRVVKIGKSNSTLTLVYTYRQACQKAKFLHLHETECWVMVRVQVQASCYNEVKILTKVLFSLGYKLAVSAWLA